MIKIKEDIFSGTIWVKCPKCGKRDFYPGYYPDQCERCGLDMMQLEMIAGNITNRIESHFKGEDALC